MYKAGVNWHKSPFKFRKQLGTILISFVAVEMPSKVMPGLDSEVCSVLIVQTCEVWEWVGRPGSETSPERMCLESGNFPNQVLTKKSCCFVLKLRFLMLTSRLVQGNQSILDLLGVPRTWDHLKLPVCPAGEVKQNPAQNYYKYPECSYLRTYFHSPDMHL